MAWEVKICKVENGYIVIHNSDSDDPAYGAYNVVKTVFQEPELNDSKEESATYNMLWFILNHFGEAGSKHDKERIRIVIEKGENYE